MRRVSSEYGARADGRVCGVEEADGAAVEERSVIFDTRAIGQIHAFAGVAQDCTTRSAKGVVVGKGAIL